MKMSDKNSTVSEQAPAPQNLSEISLFQLVETLWRQRWLIFAMACFGCSASALYAISLPNQYEASALLAPSQKSGGVLGGLASEYGGLASLAGVSIPQGEDGSRTKYAIKLVQSRLFISTFIREQGIKPQIMAANSWSPENKFDLEFDKELYDIELKSWAPRTQGDGTTEPSETHTYNKFMASFSVHESKTDGFVTISFTHISPVFASFVVNSIVNELNAEVKNQDVVEAEKSISYLKEQINSTSLTELQAVFFELIQSQTETIMLAQVRPEYVFKTIDPAIPPEIRTSPNRTQITLVGTTLGLLSAILISIVLAYLREINRI